MENKYNSLPENILNYIRLSSEEKEAIQFVYAILKHRVGKKKVISNLELRTILEEFDVKLGEPSIKKIVFNIRNRFVDEKYWIDLLIASGEGYYISQNTQEIRAWIKMQTGKVEAMELSLKSLLKQFEENEKRLEAMPDSSGQLSMSLDFFD